MQFFNSLITKKVTISASVIAATGFIAWYFTLQNSQNFNYTDKRLIKVTKLIMKELFPIYLDIASKAQKMKDALKKKQRDPEKFAGMIRERVFEKSNFNLLIVVDEMIIKRIQNVEEKILKENQMEYQKYRSSFENRKEDVIVLRTIQLKMQESLDMACKGTTPLNGVRLSSKFDIHCFYQILLDSRKSFLTDFLNLTEFFLNNNMEIGAKNNEFLKKVKQLDPREFKIKTILNFGFGISEDEPHPLAILSKAVEYFGKRDPRSSELIRTMNT